MTSSREADVIVVGTGPGGATVAREMTHRNKDVLMLEWGASLCRRVISRATVAPPGPVPTTMTSASRDDVMVRPSVD